MRWILDDGPFGHLASIRPSLTSRWLPDVLVVAGTTADALSRTPHCQTLLGLQVGERRVIGRFDIQVGGEDSAAVVLAQLHPNVHQLNDLAEHESIAWAQTHGLDAVFVCADKRAAFTGLAELGIGRVAHAFDVWMDLLHRGWLGLEEFQNVCDMTLRHDKSLPRIPGRVRMHLNSANDHLPESETCDRQ